MASYVVKRWIKALSRIIARKNAKLETAPAVTADADTAVQVHKEAPLSSDPAKDMSVDSIIAMSPWVHLVAYARATFIYVSEVLMGHLSRLALADSAVARYRKQMPLKRISTADVAGSAIAESRFNIFTADSVAVASAAPVEETTAGIAFTAVSIATANRAAVTEASAEGRQDTAHSAGLATWFLPEYADGTLSIFQVFSGVQSGDTVEIDREENSVYWANNLVTAGVLDLVFTETVTQTGNTLEVI